LREISLKDGYPPLNGYGEANASGRGMTAARGRLLTRCRFPFEVNAFTFRDIGLIQYGIVQDPGLKKTVKMRYFIQPHYFSVLKT